MKNALTYMVIGALAYGVIDMYVCNKSVIKKRMKNLKDCTIDAREKVKEMF